MAYHGPAYAVPSHASTPVVGFGSTGLRHRGLGYGFLRHGGLGYGNGGLGYGGLGYGYGGLGYGYGPSAPLGGSTTSGGLGTLPGVIPQTINQSPPAVVKIQLTPTIGIIAGPW